MPDVPRHRIAAGTKMPEMFRAAIYAVRFMPAIRGYALPDVQRAGHDEVSNLRGAGVEKPCDDARAAGRDLFRV